MKTIILPGYSEHNRIWAEKVAERLNAKSLPSMVHAWRHWKNPKLVNDSKYLVNKLVEIKGFSFSIKNEIERIIKEIGNENDIGIIAKSVGVMVALTLIPKISGKVSKVILCGIASVFDENRKELLKDVLKTVPVESILCIQNEKDKFVPFPDAEKFYHSVEPKLKVISKPRSDHEYPYFEDFLDFLT